MPSFDVVSEVDTHEVTNAVDQASREVGNRFDFKGVEASYTYEDPKITVKAENDFQLKQMVDILHTKLGKRHVDIGCLSEAPPELTGKVAHQVITLRQGIEAPLAKKIIKLIKNSKLKVQTAIQGEQVRVTGKKRDDLQSVINLLKDEQELDLPLQFINFRD